MQVNKLLATVATFVLMLGTSAAAAAITPPPNATKFLVVDSSPGDYVGQGLQYSFTSDTANFEAFQSFGHDIRMRIFPREGGFWILQFTAPSGQPLVPGTYEGALRSNTFEPERPALDIGGNGRGCNAAFGRFVVNEARFDGLFGPVLSFDAAFEFHCERPDAPGLRGEVRYSSTARPVLDTTPPVITPVIAPAPNAYGWNNSPVSVSWTLSDPESGIASSTGCAPRLLDSETAGDAISCSAQNTAGLTGSNSITVRIDRTAPVIVFSGNAGTYSVDQTVAITCAASDALSTLASSSCPAANGPAYTFPVGTTTLDATATDRADNTANVRTSFTTTVSAEALCTLTRRFVESSPSYLALTPAPRQRMSQMLIGACTRLAVLSSVLPADERDVAITGYDKTVDAMVSNGWLTTEQGGLLEGLAENLK